MQISINIKSFTLNIKTIMLCSIKFVSEEEEEEFQDNDSQKPEQVSVKDLSQRLENLQACNDLLVKKGTMLQRILNELEALEPPSAELGTKIKTVSERATLFRIAASAMVNVS